MSTIDDHARWRQQRRAAVTAPTGNLALIETRWIGPVRADVSPRPLDGSLARSTEPPAAWAQASVAVTELSRADISTGETEYGLRLWDAHSPAIQAFERIDGYDFDPAWVIQATFTAVDGGFTVPFEYIRDNGSTRNKVIPGTITFTLNGTEHRLVAFDDDGTLLLVFGDATNGTETYGAGRFLFVQRDASAAQDARNETVVLDFNRAFVPPCGFSAQYNCPMPPPQNRFTEPIRAGEKNVIFRDGFSPYHT